MTIKSFAAKNYRNLDIDKTELSPSVNILYGDNAQGKTNFLEAVYFCAFGRGIRGKDNELIMHNEKSASIKLETLRNSLTKSTFAIIDRTGKVTQKSINIDSLPVRHMKDLFGQLLVVMFSPEDLRLIKAGPAERRRFMDMEICQLSPVYYGNLKEYFRALKQRNAQLKILQKNRQHATEVLSIWDEQLITYGKKIIKSREAFIQKINETAARIHARITQNTEILKLEYKPAVDPSGYAAAMRKSHERDILRGTTSEGIHTDDIDFTINGISARQYGSQGQQRTAALSVKLAEIEIIKAKTGENPILLLDDVLSELDKHRQIFLLEQIKDLQVLITCTGIEDFVKSYFKSFNIFQIENGAIKNE